MHSLPSDGTFASLPYFSHDPTVLSGISAIAGIFRGGKYTARLLCATNKAVWQANELIRQEIYGSQVLDYRVGDILLTTSVVGRDQYGGCSSRGEIQLARSREELRLKTVETKWFVWLRTSGDLAQPGKLSGYLKGNDFVGYTEVAPNADGSITPPADASGSKKYFKLWTADWERVNTPEGTGATTDNYDQLILMDPNVHREFKELAAELYNIARGFSKRPGTKLSKEKPNSAAAKACQYLDIKTRWSHHDGTPIEFKEYGKLKAKLWRNYFKLADCCDQLSYQYAGTAHGAQGETIDFVAIDTQFLDEDRERSGWATKKGSTKAEWDPQRILYTMATRARKQLVFLVRGV